MDETLSRMQQSQAEPCQTSKMEPFPKIAKG